MEHEARTNFDDSIDMLDIVASLHLAGVEDFDPAPEEATQPSPRGSTTLHLRECLETVPKATQSTADACSKI